VLELPPLQQEGGAGDLSNAAWPLSAMLPAGAREKGQKPVGFHTIVWGAAGRPVSCSTFYWFHRILYSPATNMIS